MEALLLRSLLHASVAMVAVICLTPLVRRLAFVTGVVAHPKADRWHRDTVPMLGGIALFAGVCASMLLAAPALGFAALPVVIAGGGMFLVGCVDDLVTLKPGTKLGAQIAVACATVAVSPALDWTGRPAVDALVTIFWIIGITNALNLLDNMDGLCAGIAAVAGLASFGALVGISETSAWFAAALTGACIGFLFYNFNPASIFMGDSGSLFLGGTLAVLAISGDPATQTNMISALAVPVMLLMIPIFDTTLVTVSRLLSGRRASSGGRDHTSHRLVALGFSERQAVLILWLLATAGGAVAVLGRFATEATFMAPLLLVGLVLLGVQLARVRVYEGEDFSALVSSRYTPLLVDVTYRRRLFELLLDVVLVASCYYAAWAIRFDGDMPQYSSLILQSLPIVIGCQIFSFVVVGVYRSTWRYISLGDVGTFAKGVALGTVSSVIALVYVHHFEGYSRSVFVIYAMMVGACVVGARLSERLVADLAGRHRQAGRRALIYGAGDGAALLLRELLNNPGYDYVPVGLLDDDSSKHRKRIQKVQVLGGIDTLRDAILRTKPQVVIVSTTAVGEARLRQISSVCLDTGTQLLQFRIDLRRLELSEPAAREWPVRVNKSA